MVPPVSGGITNKKKWTIVYPNIPTALRPVLHGEGIYVPKPLKEFTIDGKFFDVDGSPTGIYEVLLFCM
jgi:hypothetical protein